MGLYVKPIKLESLSHQFLTGQPLQVHLPHSARPSRVRQPFCIIPKLIYCESGRIGPYFPDFSANRTTMHLQIEKIWTRFPTFSLRSFLPRRLLVPHNM